MSEPTTRSIQDLQARIAELGPPERVRGDDEVVLGMDKVVRNCERMELRIELFDLVHG